MFQQSKIILLITSLIADIIVIVILKIMIMIFLHDFQFLFHGWDESVRFQKVIKDILHFVCVAADCDHFDETDKDDHCLIISWGCSLSEGQDILHCICNDDDWQNMWWYYVIGLAYLYVGSHIWVLFSVSSKKWTRPRFSSKCSILKRVYSSNKKCCTSSHSPIGEPL